MVDLGFFISMVVICYDIVITEHDGRWKKIRAS